MKDGVNLMVNATTATIRRLTTVHAPLTPTGLYLYEAPECYHPTGNLIQTNLIHHLHEESLAHNYLVVWSLCLGLYLYEAPECHHPTDVRETPSKHPPTAQQFKYQQTE